MIEARGSVVVEEHGGSGEGNRDNDGRWPKQWQWSYQSRVIVIISNHYMDNSNCVWG